MNIQSKSTDLPPFKPLPMKAPDIDVVRKPDGTVYLSQRHALGEMHRSTVHLFEQRAAAHPDRNLIAERTPLPGGGTGDWRFISYGEMNARANAIAQAMLTRGLGPDTPLMVLSGNSIAHASMMLGGDEGAGAGGAGSVAYSIMSGDHAKAAARVCDDKAEDDLRGAGSVLCPRAGRRSISTASRS